MEWTATTSERNLMLSCRNTSSLSSLCSYRDRISAERWLVNPSSEQNIKKCCYIAMWHWKNCIQMLVVADVITCISFLKRKKRLYYQKYDSLRNSKRLTGFTLYCIAWLSLQHSFMTSYNYMQHYHVMLQLEWYYGPFYKDNISMYLRCFDYREVEPKFMKQGLHSHSCLLLT